VWSGILQRAFLFLLLGLALVVLAAAPAEAAEPAVYELPNATHANSLAVGADGTVWFAPTHGTEWEGTKGGAVGSLAAGRKVEELPVPGFHRPVLGPTGEVWVSNLYNYTLTGGPFRIARLAPSGQIAREYVVGHGGGGIKMAVAADAVWFTRWRMKGRAAIERLSIADGSVRRFRLRPLCQSNALAIAPGGAVWFTEACRRHTSEGSELGGSTIGRIGRGGGVRRWRLPGRVGPIAIAIGPEGIAWFGVRSETFESYTFGHIAGNGHLTEYRVPNGDPGSIAVGPEGRLWFQSSFGGWDYRALDSVGVDGRPREPICADPTCQLEPTGLIAAPDGSLWYGLARPNLNTGGGGSGLGIDMEIANEAGFIAHLAP
jgi:streptogramin lyase